MIELVLGGARSGKSSFAQQRAKSSGKSVSYIATATSFDNEMQARISRHQAERPAEWTLIEQPLDLPSIILSRGIDCECLLLVDCLTLWLSNEMFHRPKAPFEQLNANLCGALESVAADVVLVSNEVGMGIVPMGEISRQFVDWQGWMNQSVARVAENVTFVAAGLPISLKGSVCA